MTKWRVLARHKWVAGATITESINEENQDIRRYTATVHGWKNFKIYEGDPKDIDVNKIVEKVREIRDRIESGDVTIFTENTIIATS